MAGETVGAGAPLIVCGCTAIPWIVVFYIYAFSSPDPEHCWVVKGQLGASAMEPVGVTGEYRDVAQFWRLMFTWLFWVYLTLGIFPVIGGALICMGPSAAIPGGICGGLAGCGLLAKVVLFWWGLILRVTEEGSVTAGKMVTECQATNPGAAAIASTSAAVAEAGASDAAAAIASVDPCNPTDVFQIKSGKLWLAWIIISAIKGV